MSFMASFNIFKFIFENIFNNNGKYWIITLFIKNNDEYHNLKNGS